ncbi:polyprenyl synthetase family protein [Patescibacteria group bacterium]|nr:polyprenyl synthetase family protein [Patescibacteria group bacterium]
MKAKAYIRDYIKKATPFLDHIFEKQEKEAAKISPVVGEMIRTYRDFMGGKNLRGALVKLSYECFGGKNKKAILEASLMVEVAHSFLLMHDDIMDKDTLRRGKPTIHFKYKKLSQKKFAKGDFEHYGTSMALDLGDIGFMIAHLILANSQFSAEIKEKVLRKFNQTILDTGFGQAIDFNFEYKQKVTEKDVIKIHRYKTANYTITGPLQYGALFAGADEQKIGKIEKYGLLVGIAFQIRDDELGLFSDQKTLGKPIGSDVKENKNTLLHLKALEWANAEDKKFLQSAYGNSKLTVKDVRKVQRITIKTGAFEYSQKTAKGLVEKGKKFVTKITSDLEYQDTLYNLADFMIERES